MPRKIFTAGEVLAAADVNNFLMDQSVMTFADADARTAAIPTPTAGMVTYLIDEDAFEFFNGSAFVAFGGGAVAPFISMEYLIIAGGGGSNSMSSGGATLATGGGGAGGYRSSVIGENSGGNSSAESLQVIELNTNHTVTVGAGGSLGSGSTEPTNGINSVFSVRESLGGGHSFGNPAAVGGSGGGATGINGTKGGAGTFTQGFAGGNAAVGNNGSGAGGGGAGGVGGNGTAGSQLGGAAGAGIESSVNGTPTTRATGGLGGRSNADNVGADGAVNTGNGATGSGINNGGNVIGANGGSGIVILRYPNNFTITIGSGLTGFTETVGDNKVTTITNGTGNVSFA